MSLIDRFKEKQGVQPVGQTIGPIFAGQTFGRNSGMRPSGLLSLGLLNMGSPRSGGRRQDLPRIGRFERRPEARAEMLSNLISQFAPFSRPPVRGPEFIPAPPTSEPMGMQQGGLVQQVIADRQRVLDSFTPNPYDQYQYLMENPATRQAPTDDEGITGGFMPADPTPATPADTFTNLLDTVQSATGGSDPAPMSPLEARIAELMENRGMTQQEAAANQAFAAQQGADLNNDGAVTNAEYAEFMRAQEPTVSTMPVGDPVPFTPNPMGGGFLSGFNTDVIQQAIEEYRASMGDRSGGVDAPATAPATPAIPDNLQDRIAALTGGAGTFGGMIPNIDVARLRELMAELYGGQTPTASPPLERPPKGNTVYAGGTPGFYDEGGLGRGDRIDDFDRREPMPRPPGGRRIISDPRRFTAMPPMNLPDSGGMGARIPSSRK